MKKILLTLCFLHASLFMFAQDLAKEGKEWSALTYWDHSTEPGPFVDTLFYKTHITFLQGDTVIEGFIYKKVYQSPNEDKSNAHLLGYLREEGKKVYGRSFSQNSITPEGLLYNFDVKRGDSVYVQNYFRYDNPPHMLIIIGGVQTTVIEGIECTEVLFNFFTAPTLWAYSWYSSFGSKFGLLTYDRAPLIGVYRNNLLCCKDSGNVIYMNEEEGACYKDGFTVDIKENEITSAGTFYFYPNPAKGKTFLQYDGIPQKAEVRITNGIGIAVKQMQISLESNNKQEIDLSGFPKGIYYVQIVTPLWRRVERVVVL